LAGIEQRQDMGMSEIGHDRDLAQEPLGSNDLHELGFQNLDCDLATVLAVVGEVYDRTTTVAEFALYGVAISQRDS